MGFSHVEDVPEQGDIVLLSIKEHIQQQHSAIKQIDKRESSTSVQVKSPFKASLLPITLELLQDGGPELLTLITMNLHQFKVQWHPLNIHKVLENLPSNFSDIQLIFKCLDIDYLKEYYGEYAFLWETELEGYDSFRSNELAIVLERSYFHKNTPAVLEAIIHDVTISRLKTIADKLSLRIRKYFGKFKQVPKNRKYIRGLVLEQKIIGNHDKYKEYRQFLLNQLNTTVLNTEFDLKESDYNDLENIRTPKSLKRHMQRYNLLRLLRPRDLFDVSKIQEHRILHFIKNSPNAYFWFNCLLESAILYEKRALVELLLMGLIHSNDIEILPHLKAMLRPMFTYSFFQKFTSLSLQENGFQDTTRKCEHLLGIRYYSWSRETSKKVIQHIDKAYFLHNNNFELEAEYLAFLVKHLHLSSLTELRRLLQVHYHSSEDEGIQYWTRMLQLRLELRKELNLR